MKYAKDQNGKVYCIIDEEEFFAHHSNLFVRPATFEEWEKQNYD